jgi:lantibiotic modifying enzyme
LKLPDSLKDQLKQRLVIIEDFMEGPEKDLLHHEKLSLYVGRPGMLMMRSLIANKTNSARQKRKARADFNFIMKELQDADFIITPFSSGIAGIGFAFDYVNNCEILHEDITHIIEEIDDTVEGDVPNLIVKSNYDLLHGVIGMGVYLIRKKRYNEVKKIINSLSKEAVRGNKEVKWKRFDEYRTRKYIYDLGFAHGNAGILFFLGFAYNHGIEKETCKELICGLFEFYDSNIQDHKKNGSFFGYSYDADDYQLGKKPVQHSRLAWCYGDLGVLVTLIQVALWMNDPEKANYYERLLEKTIERRDQQDVQVVDACFCHGSAGNAFLYKHAFELTKNEKFKDIAVYWLENALAMANNTKALTGYNFLVGTRGEDPYQNDFPGLLEGFLGVYLVFHSFINDEENLVKELFFLG